MAKSLDVILVVDVESTCWERNPPRGQSSEIIEIGLCPVDVSSLKRLEKRSLLVRPVRSEISDFCTQLTTLTPDMFTSAGSMSDAVDILRNEYDSGNRLWASWGDYDRRQFERVCRELNVDYPFGHGHLNIKSLFAAGVGAGEMGLGRAYRNLGLTLEGTHHRGHDDAWNIAGILCRILKAIRAAEK